MTYFVTMTDKLLSKWGEAKGKISKVVFVCETLEQAYIVEANAIGRSEMKWVSVVQRHPSYSKARYHVTTKTIATSPAWYKIGFGRKVA
jgi:hypothetical protein